MDLIKKLRLNTEQPLWLIDAPESCTNLFKDFDIKTKIIGKKPVGQLVLFALSRKEMEHQISILNDAISDDTVFWICYPKQSGSISSDLIEMKSWDILSQLGYRGQTSVSVNDDWSGFRTTKAVKKTASICDLPMDERKAEGIDFVNRTAYLPVDAVASVSMNPGMMEFFNSMAFTHKKEYVLAIIEAKQPETRKRRIDKMVEMLGKKMDEKMMKGKKK
jgi:hypothetical protein